MIYLNWRLNTVKQGDTDRILIYIDFLPAIHSFKMIYWN